MADFPAWLKSDWFSIVQTIGIVSGLFYTGIACRQTAKAQQTQNLLAFAERHRSLWSEAYQRPELNRIFGCDVDVLKKPASTAEEEFLNIVFVHFEMGWRLAKSTDRSDLKPLSIDAAFFLPPLASRHLGENEKLQKSTVC